MPVAGSEACTSVSAAVAPAPNAAGAVLLRLRAGSRCGQQLVAAGRTLVDARRAAGTPASLSRRPTAAQQTEQGAQPDEQLRRRRRRHTGCIIGYRTARGHRRHRRAAAGQRPLRHIAAPIVVIVVQAVVVGIIGQPLQQLCAGLQRIRDVPQRQRDAGRTRMLPRRRVQRQGYVVYAAAARAVVCVVVAAAGIGGGRKILADGADALSGSVAVAVAAVVGAVAGFLQLLASLGYVLICNCG